MSKAKMGLISLRSSCAKLFLRNSQYSKQKNNSQEGSQWALDFSRSVKKTFRAKERNFYNLFTALNQEKCFKV